MADLSLETWAAILGLSCLISPLTLLALGRIISGRRQVPVSMGRVAVLQRRAQMFEAALSKAPIPVWLTDTDGKTVWQNPAGRDLRDDNSDLFDSAAETRVSLPAAQGKTRWFDVKTAGLGDQIGHFAPQITNEVQAENTRREFMQTLTKTFANLTTGMVVFDKNRQVALFNPALLDHTGLTATYLSARPSLMSFFDQLRDRQVMPEPKNYANWRAQINEVVETAAGGLYQETWQLPGGTVFRVSGRPHPDGAVAFLFEDISADISLTRRFRAQLDVHQQAIDALGSAIAVIGPNETVGFCNRVCRDYLQVDPDASFAVLSAQDLIRLVDEKLPGDGFWQQALPSQSCTHRDPVQQVLLGMDGQLVECTVTQLAPDMTLLEMRVGTQGKSTAPRALDTVI